MPSENEGAREAGDVRKHRDGECCDDKGGVIS
jgi:hypothetical protein